MGMGTAAGMGRERGRGRGRVWRPGDDHRMGTGTGAGTETRAVSEMRTGTGTRTGSGRAKERRRSARNRTRTVDAIRHFYSVRVIISVDRGCACGHPTAPFARPGACTHASHRGRNRVRKGPKYRKDRTGSGARSEVGT